MYPLNKILNILKDLGLPSSSQQEVRNILDKYGEDQQILDLIGKILHSEVTKSFLSSNHLSKTYLDKNLLTTNLSRDISLIISLLYPKKNLTNTSNFFGIHDKDLTATALSSLHKKGYWILPYKIPKKIIAQITEGLACVPFYMRNSLKTLSGYSHNIAESIPKTTAWVYDQQDILNQKPVQDILMDTLVLEIISSYLNCEPIHVQSNCWWSKSSSNNRHSMSINAQLFHQDREFVKFLKVFIYLNDVNEKNGAHIYVEGSHTDNRFENDPTYKVSSRIDDDVIEDKYGKDKIITMTGEAGTVIIEDTSGFHKGMPVLSGHRLLLQIEYANTLYFNSTEAYSPDSLSESYKSFLIQNPRFSLKYDHNKYVQNMNHLKKARFKKNLVGYSKSLIRNLTSRK